MRKQLLIGGIVFAIAAGASLLLHGIIASRPGVNRHNFRRLQWEMPEKEVEAILGGPGEATHMTNDGFKKVWTEPNGSVCIWLIIWDGKVWSGGYSDDHETLSLEWESSPSKTTLISRWFAP
jgi:hypothetical protein